MPNEAIRTEIERFRAELPVERASTPPASWYRDPAFLGLERSGVFHGGWQFVGRRDQVAGAGQYFTGCLLGEPYVVLRDESGTLRAFLNVCRHHASTILEAEGVVEELRCPYHGWTYGLDGGLRRAPRVGGIEDFDRNRYGLIPLPVREWGPFIVLCLAGDPDPPDERWGTLLQRLTATTWDRLRFVERRVYTAECNWKVYVDNYLDGGYHVPFLHGGLGAQLDLRSYRTEIFEDFSIQSCAGGTDAQEVGLDFSDRIGDEAVYAWIYPNFMINRYGPVLDTNLVVPETSERCRIVFDYFFDPSVGGDFIEKSLAASEQVQREDEDVCASVQRGLASRAYGEGRYAPRVETGEHHFHRLLARHLRATMGE